ncbi:SET domain-containing protein [Microthyrium microscopicum]|uniref:SET domain-containing protein n=1 Tax=Microthyrium microscopicum TaxID=703497 RepID=A0A6A6UDE0_9PEZI|nr:SET domain-containing protein [Microthyrium microscopicum]
MSLFEVTQTAHAGRGVFATKDVPKNTPLLATDFTSLAVIQREYRREVCANCFLYERGRNLKVRNTATNFSFCSTECQETWEISTGKLGMEAWESVEAFLKRKSGKMGSSGLVNGTAEPTDGDGDISMGDYPRRPSKVEIDAIWEAIEGTAHFIDQARKGSNAKPHRRAVQAALGVCPHPDILYFLVAGALAHHHSATTSELDRKGQTAWTSLLDLAADTTPFSSAFHLRQHVHSYLHLLCLLPVELLPSITPTVCHQIVAHDTHNAFGIRSLDDSGSEFFGWGVWPEASYFNHSCSPNVSKTREGRQWSFWARHDIKAGEQLNISYLGGDENDMPAEKRGKHTQSIWGFVCACARCAADKCATKTALPALPIPVLVAPALLTPA